MGEGPAQLCFTACHSPCEGFVDAHLTAVFIVS